jgi:hypothetical protein
MKSKFNYLIVLIGIIAAIGITSCNQKKSAPADNEAVSANGKAMYSDTATSSVRVFDQNGKVCIQQSNTYYQVENYYDNGGKIPLLLKIKKTELCVADSENREKIFEISAKSVMDTKPISWEAKVVATGLVIKDNSILAIYEGNDNEDDYYKRYSLLDGKETFSCSYGETKVSIPNVRDKRFIGMVARKAVTQPVQKMKEENLIGIINYGSSDAPLSMLKLKLKRSKVADKIPSGTPDMVLVPLNASTAAIEDGKTIVLMKADQHYQPSDVKDFSVKFTYYFGDDHESTEIIIPIVNDKLDLAGAKYDKEIFELSN